MSPWGADIPPPERRPLGPLGWVRLLGRGLLVGTTVYGGLVVLLILRMIERPIFGLHRPVTPWITVWVCRATLFWLGLRVTRHGTPMDRAGAFVANHVSWLDIFVLNAQAPLYFVAKAEVAGWPGIGWLARATGTAFIARKASEAAAQKALFEARLRAGHHLTFFPEGTSTDGRRVLPFKSTLFAAFFEEGLRDRLAVQPVALVYHAPEGADPRFYGWWGEMSFGASLLDVLAARRQGRVDLVFHEALPVASSGGRKVLANQSESRIRDSLTSFH